MASPCLWGKLQNLFFSKMFKQVVMSFCVAGAALCNIPTCLITCRKWFCVASTMLLRRFHEMSCSFRGRRSILEISVVILRGRRSTSDASHCVLYTPHYTFHTLHFNFTLHTLHSTLYTPHFILHTFHSTLYTLHFTLHTLHPTLHTLHSRPPLYTANLTPHTLHSTLHT